MWLRRKEWTERWTETQGTREETFQKKAAMTESGIYVQIIKSCIDHAHVPMASFHQEALYQLNNRINSPVNGTS